MRTPARDTGAESNRAREIALARRALAEDDTPRAAHHAAAALAFDPDDPEALQLVDGLIAWRPEAAAFPTGDGWGYTLVRARAAWLEGARHEAFGTLMEVATVAVHLDLSGWWNRILDDAEAAGERMPWGRYLLALPQLTRGTVGVLRLRPAQQAFFDRWAALGLRLERHVDPEHLPTLALACSGFLRRAGRYGEAVTVAARGAAVADPGVRPDLRGQQGLALRGAGRWDEAIAMFVADADTHLDRPPEIARTQIDAGRLDDAITTLEAHRIHWSHGHSELSDVLGLLHARRTPTTDPHLQRVLVLLDDAPPSYDDIRRLYLHETLPDVAADETREAPSARMTLALAATGSAEVRGIDDAARGPVVPDPGEPLDPTRGVRLWVREADGALVQAVPRPSPATVALVTDLASRDLATDRAWRRAQTAAPDADGDDLVRALVWPPPAADPSDSATWVFRWQRCACLLLAAVDPEVPWPISRRRDLLRSVLFSHPDWTTGAALLALLEAALDDPTAAAEARTWCLWLVRRVPTVGACPWASSMERVANVLPGMPPDVLPASLAAVRVAAARTREAERSETRPHPRG